MSTHDKVFERLLRDAVEGAEHREHVIESGSYLMQNVEEKFSEQFDKIVAEISSDKGRPTFGDGAGSNGSKIPPPPGVLPQKTALSQYKKILKTTLWREENNYIWVQYRIEMDAKQRPNSYEILLGAKKMVPREQPQLVKAREHEGPKGIQAFWIWFREMCRFG